MDAYDFVITLLALNKRYSRLIENNGINHTTLYEKIINCPPEFLEKIRIIPHPIHRDSETLNEALYHLLKNDVLRLLVPGRDYIWKFPLTPEEYFEQRIKPNLKEDEISEIEKIVTSID